MSLKEELKKNNPTLGLEVTLKKMKNQEVKKVYIASNYKDKKEILALGKSLNIPVEIAEEDSKKIGVLCKKPFNISILSFQ